MTTHWKLKFIVAILVFHMISYIYMKLYCYKQYMGSLIMGLMAEFSHDANSKAPEYCDKLLLFTIIVKIKHLLVYQSL
jgi:hypothetical protein